MSLFPKAYSPLANWPWLRISPQSSLFIIYYLILTAWQWLMSFTCIPVQIEPNKSPLRKRLLALLLWEIGHLSSPSRSCLGRFIFIRGGRRALRAEPPHLPRHSLILEREEGGGEVREREREREKHLCEINIGQLPPIRALTADYTHSLGMCPDLESNPWPFGLGNDIPANWATLARAMSQILNSSAEMTTFISERHLGTRL